jgi:hypothetical protein
MSTSEAREIAKEIKAVSVDDGVKVWTVAV